MTGMNNKLNRSRKDANPPKVVFDINSRMQST